MKKLLSFVAVLAMALVVAAPSMAKAGETYYFDNTNTNWSNVSVWSWSDGEDPLWSMTSGCTAWPGVELAKDDATGYYVWTVDGNVAKDGAVMFNNGGEGVEANEQTCDALARAAVGKAGYVCVPTAKNTAEDAAADSMRAEGQWFGEWKEVASSGNADADNEVAPDTDTEEVPEDKEEAPAPEVTPDAGKDEAPQTGDVAPIAAVAVLAVASMAVVVATRKRMA